MNTKTKNFLNKLIGRHLTFGDMLASLRKADEVTQVELARKIGVSKGLICDIEKSRRTASIELAIKIAKAMGYSEKVMIKYVLEDQLQNAKVNLKVKLEAA